MKDKIASPLVSIIIPAYNFGRYLPRALNSVRNQSYENLEVCLTNDGSTDNTDEVIQRFRDENPQISFVYIVQPNRGVSAARNAAVARSRGEYLSFLDPDDFLKPDCIQVLMDYRSRYPNMEIISGGIDCLEYDNQGVLFSRLVMENKEIISLPAREVFKRLFYQNMMGMISIIVSRRLFDRAGGFDDKIRTGEDLDFFFRVTRYGDVLLIPEILGIVYKYKAGLSQQPGKLFKSARKIYRENRGHLLQEFPREGRRVFRKAMALLHLIAFGLYRSTSSPLRFAMELIHLGGIIINMPRLLFDKELRKQVTSEHTSYRRLPVEGRAL